MNRSPSFAESSSPLLPTCQPCGVGCHHAAQHYGGGRGEWIWCEHPQRTTAARLVRAEADCPRFEAPRPAAVV